MISVVTASGNPIVVSEVNPEQHRNMYFSLGIGECV